MQSPSGPKVYPKSTRGYYLPSIITAVRVLYGPPLYEEEGGGGPPEEEEEEFITSGNWRGKHNSLSRGAGAGGLDARSS